MKKQIFIISIFLFSLLFTSCLADYLNEKLDYHVPIILSYESVQATEPKTIKIPSETPLTAENLPELSEPGWTFAGWYTDTTFTTKVQEGAVFTQNTTLYAKWVPATDTPFTINNYFLDTRTGFSDFILRTDLTQHLTGTTGEFIEQDFYDVRYTQLYDSELDNYEFIYWHDDNYNNVRIKADGSSVANNYYYLNKIYNYEFEQIVQALPNTPWCYWFYFLQDDPTDSFDFFAIRNAINENSKIVENYYDNMTQRYKNRYNKHYTLNLTGQNFTTIYSYAFENANALNQVDLPSTCTQINYGAFSGCDDLDYV